MNRETDKKAARNENGIKPKKNVMHFFYQKDVQED